MDRDIWKVLSTAALSATRRLRRPRRRFAFSDHLIIRMWLWAVLHDRPLCWACRRENYTSLFQPRRLPSVSQFCKRLHTFRFLRLRVLLHRRLTRAGRDDLFNFLDGKALAIRDHSTDHQALAGPAGRKIRRGYKLHVRATASGFLREYRVFPMNRAEPSTARQLLRELRPNALVLADANLTASGSTARSIAAAPNCSRRSADRWLGPNR